METCQCGNETYGHLDLCAACAVVELLIMEHQLGRKEAERLVKDNTDTMVAGLMSGSLRATAMALLMR